jgi:hypothetical protein
LTVNVVVVVAVLPAASVAVMVIVWVPIPTTVPASGLCVTVTGPQLSLAVVPTTTSGIVACPAPSALVLVGRRRGYCRGCVIDYRDGLRGG